MGSRVVGFRVPDDLAKELERVSSERGLTSDVNSGHETFHAASSPA